MIVMRWLPNVKERWDALLTPQASIHAILLLHDLAGLRLRPTSLEVATARLRGSPQWQMHLANDAVSNPSGYRTEKVCVKLSCPGAASVSSGAHCKRRSGQTIDSCPFAWG
jgi:hypothetical protein